ncbi:MAG: sugar phosphate nucleotidyltransferase [Chthoniobacterales bacterium]
MKLSMPEAVILAGGLGTRLKSEVADRPKPLAWVGGRYFLSHILSQLADAGVKRVVIAAGHMGQHIQQAFEADYAGMEIIYSFEEKLLGTGGALRKAIASVRTDELFVLNGDSFCETDFAAMMAQHHSKKNKGTMVVYEIDHAARFGRLKIKDDAILDFEEKPASGDFINAGVYVLNRDLVMDIRADGVVSLERDVFPSWAQQGLLGAFVTNGRFVDIGLPETLQNARRLMAEDLVPSFMEAAGLIQLNPEAQKMLASREIHEINRWKLTVGVIVRDKQGNILLERRQDCGLWGLLGGRMDFGESIEQTAAREVKEEAGLDIRVERLVGIYSDPKNRILSYPNGDVVQPLTIVVEASITGGLLQKSEESLDLRFFPPDQLPAEVISAAQDCLRHCLQCKASFLH